MLSIGLTIILLSNMCRATKPPGYVERPKIPDPHPPDYNYSYAIADNGGNAQGHQETRRGENTDGRYFLQIPKESWKQDVKYHVDDWGYHPLVQYSSSNGHSSSQTSLAFGEKAVAELHKSPGSGIVEQTQPPPTQTILLAGTVLPAGTSTNGYIHHSSKDGTAVLHPLPVTTAQPPATLIAEGDKIFQGTHQGLVEEHAKQKQNNVDDGHSLRTVQSQPDLRLTQEPFLEHVNNIQIIPLDRVVDTSTPGGIFVNKVENYATYNVFPQHATPSAHQLISSPLYAEVPDYDETVLGLENKGEFGAKISSVSAGAKGNINAQINAVKNEIPIERYVSRYVSSPPQPGTSRGVQTQGGISRLVASTQNLISNEDLLNINSAAEDISNELNIGPFTKPLFTPTIAPGHTSLSAKEQNIFSLQNKFETVSTYDSKNPIDTFSDRPIIVPELEANKVSAYATPPAYLQSGYEIKTINAEINGPTDNNIYIPSTSNPLIVNTIVVTPRPVSQKFLAPLQAGLTLVNANHTDLVNCLDTSGSDSGVKQVTDEVIENENSENNSREQQLDDAERSVPSHEEHRLPVETLQDILLRSQYFHALDSSRKIQESMNQQLYQQGAQQIVIHPEGKQLQQKHEELSQQIQEESHQTLEHHADNVNQVEKSVEQQSFHYQTEVIQEPAILQQELTITQYNNHIPDPVTVDGRSNFNDGGRHSNQIYNYNQQNVQDNTGLQQYTQQQFIQGTSTVEQLPYNHHQQHYTQHPPQQLGHILIPHTYGWREQNTEKNAQAEQARVIEKQVPTSYALEKQSPYILPIETPVAVPYPIEASKVIEKPVEVTKYINTPYPINVPVPQPVPFPVHFHHQVPVDRIIERKVPYAVTVEKIVEKKVEVPVEVKVPYAVEKIVEKIVDRPVEVTKYVQQLVEKKVPYPVEVQVPVEVKVPQPYPYPVEKIVEKPYPVQVNVPYAVEKIVEKPYGIPYPVHVPYASYSAPAHTNSLNAQSKPLDLNYSVGKLQYGISLRDNYYLGTHQTIGKQTQNSNTRNSLYTDPHHQNANFNFIYSQSNNPYAQGFKHNSHTYSYGKNTPSSNRGKIHFGNSYHNGNQYTITKFLDNYFGPVPPISHGNTWTNDLSFKNNYNHNYINGEVHFKLRRNYEQDRAGRNLKIEYGGFKPPLIPSIEIDLDGFPIKTENA